MYWTAPNFMKKGGGPPKERGEGVYLSYYSSRSEEGRHAGLYTVREGGLSGGSGKMGGGAGVTRGRKEMDCGGGGDSFFHSCAGDLGRKENYGNHDSFAKEGGGGGGGGVKEGVPHLSIE